MKTILLLIIVVVCSSIDQPGAVKIEQQQFKNGKLVLTKVSEKGWYVAGLNICGTGADSLTFKLYTEK